MTGAGHSDVRKRGRILPVVINDHESEARTPSQPLYVIPAEARDPFMPVPPMCAVSSAEADLSRIGPGRPAAAGATIEIQGRIVDESGNPARGILMEIWNANTYGRYSHTLDAPRTDAPLDPNFYGFGRVITDDAGRYRLKTIKPGAYLARSDIGWWRPPHVHFSILGAGVRLVTQLYFPDEPLNLQDYIHLMIPEQERPRVVAVPSGAGGFVFDIVMRGRCRTPFETGHGDPVRA